MEFKGRVIVVRPEVSGQKKDGGTWVKQEYVIENHDQYPKKMCFEVFDAEKIAQFAIKVGEELNVSFDIDARQWQDRWFNSIRAWKVDKVGTQAVAQSQQQAAPPIDDGDSLPF